MTLEFLPKELIVLLLGMSPVSEVSGAIPVGMLVFNFSPAKAYLLGVIGNILIVLPLLFALEWFSEFLSYRFPLFKRFISWLFERTRKRHKDHFHYWRWASLALFLFVASPFPLTGAWSGAVAATVFGIPMFRAALVTYLGVVTSGAIVLGLTVLGVSIVGRIPLL